MTQTELLPLEPAISRPWSPRAGENAARYAAGVLALALAYYCAAKLGQTLRYTASVAAIWPPAGVGIAALYLFGLRWWPGVLLAECVVNSELLIGPAPLPVTSVLGQQVGNLAEVVVGALLLRRMIGSRAALDRADRVGAVAIAVAVATGLSAAVGTLSMLAGDVIGAAEAPTFMRTWWLGDGAGGLLVVAGALVWIPDPRAAWARVRRWDGALLLVAVTALSLAAVSSSEPVTYVAFPALMLVAFRLGPPGAVLGVLIATVVVIGVTAHDAGPFSNQPIDHRALATQVFVLVMTLTTLFVAAVVSERERAGTGLADATRREGERATEERHRIARELHDSVSQSLFSTALETRTAQRALAADARDRAGVVARQLSAIGQLTRGAQDEMRAMIFELADDSLDAGFAVALERHAAALTAMDGPTIDVRVEADALPPHHQTQAQLFAIAREALANVFKHARASVVEIRVSRRPGVVVLEVRDDGVGFDPFAAHPGHYGLESMRGRAASIGGHVALSSARGGAGAGTVVRVEVPLDAGGRPDRR